MLFAFEKAGVEQKERSLVLLHEVESIGLKKKKEKELETWNVSAPGYGFLRPTNMAHF